MDAQKKANKKWREKNREHSNYLKNRSASRTFIRRRATQEDLEELTELIKNRKEELKMNYREELERLQKGNGTNGKLQIHIYENKAELLQRLSENAGDETEVAETYDYLKEELSYLNEDTALYSVDRENGMPEYYEDAKEAYESL